MLSISLRTTDNTPLLMFSVSCSIQPICDAFWTEPAVYSQKSHHYWQKKAYYRKDRTWLCLNTQELVESNESVCHQQLSSRQLEQYVVVLRQYIWVFLVFWKRKLIIMWKSQCLVAKYRWIQFNLKKNRSICTEVLKYRFYRKYRSADRCNIWQT